ncbi:MAG TPA: glutathione binding-like protein [Lysobacter sp.]|nr:glutathione binding-like protein [Lysobacter sp.]
MSRPLTLFYSPGACSLAPHVLLEEVGATFDTVRVPVREGANLRPEYLAINPRGRLPALRIGDEVLTENPAVLTWIAFAHPQAALLPPAGSVEFGRALEWLAWLTSSVHIAYAQLWRPARFVGPGAPPAVESPVQNHGRTLIEQYYAEIESRLEGRDYAVGDRFGVADANLLPFYRWGGLIGIDMRREFPHWTAHVERMLERPAVRRVIEREAISLWP